MSHTPPVVNVASADAFANAAAFIKNISFRHTMPLDAIDIKGMSQPLRKAFEYANTLLPAEEASIRANIDQVWEVPKMSTLAIGAIVNKIVASMPGDACYVNVGVWNGFSFLCGMAGNPDKLCVGIDNFSLFGGPRAEFMGRFEKYKNNSHSFFDMDYKMYFSQFHKMPIGLYFYDGAHDYENQLEGIVIADPFIIRGGYVLVDDTNWTDPYTATMNFLSKNPGKYQIVLDEKTAANGHPTFWNGLLVLRKL